ncbi:MAG: patatin-like phospholipase family protein [Chloroflexota bacterium]
MRPFRKNVAIAIDGGGIRGVMVAKALTMLERELGRPLHEVARLTVGTSTGSILAAGIASGLDAQRLFEMYQSLGTQIFKKTLASRFWFFRGYRYSRKPLEAHLREALKDKTLGDLWNARPSTALVVTTFDLVSNYTRFLKSWKPQYQDWPVVKAVLASSAAPTFFPVLDGRYSDGGVGSYNNPCFMAAFELAHILKWNPKETTLLSLGTGRSREHIKVGDPDKYSALQWIPHVMETLSEDATDQQVHLVKAMYPGLDFRRYQIIMDKPIGLDDPSQIPLLIQYGETMGANILNDELDPLLRTRLDPAPTMNAAATRSASRRQTSRSGSLRRSRSRTRTKSARAPRTR